MPDTTAIAIYKMGLDTQDYVRGAAAAKQSTDAVVASAEKLATTEEKVSRATRTSGDELSKLAARYDQRIKLEQRLVNEQARMARLEREGIGSPEERARVYSLVETSIRRQIDDLNKQEAAMRKSATTTGLARHEMINLSRQIQDVGVSLAGGQSPFRILIEQGSQIADIFVSSKATVADFFRGISASIAGLGTRAAAFAIGGVVTALVVGAGAAAVAWASAQKDVELALLGIGRASGATAQSINQIAKAGATTFGLSISEAREFATILAQTGKIGVDQLGPLVDIGKNLAITLGTSSTEAAKTLGKALAEPGTGIQQLNQALGQFDAATIRHVQNLVAQNKVLEAQKTILEGVAQATKNAQDAVSNSAAFWTALGNKISNAVDIVGEYIAKSTGIGQSTQQELERLIAEWNRLQDIIARVGDPTGKWGAAAEQVMLRIGLINTAIERVGVIAEDARRKLLSMADQKLVRDISPEIAQFEQLKNAAEGLGNLLQRIGGSGGAKSPILAEMGQTLQQVELSANRAREALSSALSPAERLTKEFELSVKAINARTSAERAAVAAEQTSLQLAGQNVSASEKRVAIERAVTLEITRQAAQHKDNTAALEDQLRVAQALPGHAQQVAQEEATINALLREGFTLMQAQEQAALQRAIAVEQANRAVDSQIISLRQSVEMERARLEGTEASVAAAQAYANAMRSGASETKAAALAAATLEANLERAQIAAEMMANQIARGGKDALGIGDLANKLAKIGTGGGGSFAAGEFIIGAPAGSYGSVQTSFGTGTGGPLVGSAGMSTAYTPSMPIDFRKLFEDNKAAIEKAAQAQEEAARVAADAARAQQDAARAAQDAAKAQAEAAKAAREAYISQLDEAIADIVATKLLAGQSAQAVNMLIETGAIQFGTASTRFQTQLDLYKRAGASNAQTAADIRAGIIGEGARPSELLAALDSLTDAVDANTDAQLGLSPFYTSQGDRQLGYRGYTVQKGLSNIPGTGVGGSTTTIPGGTGTGGTGTGTQYPYSPGTGGGIMGGIVNDPGTVSYSGGFGGSGYQSGTYVGNGWAVLPDGNWLYLPGGQVAAAGGNQWLGNIYSYKNGMYADVASWLPGFRSIYPAGSPQPSGGNIYQTTGTQGGSWSRFSEGGIMSAQGPMLLRSYQEGGIADRPQMALFGEGSQPEAFVPLKGGAIPVKLVGNAANQNQPSNVVNINAPLIHFAAEPTRDEVRESAFQAAQMLRRVAMG